MSPPMIFISYATESFDSKVANKLALLLAPFQERGDVSIFLDNLRIPVGGRIDETIARAIDVSDIAVLLISPDYMNPSRYTAAVEIPHILDRHEAGNLRIAPVLIRPSLLDGFDWLSNTRFVNDVKEPLVQYDDDQAEFEQRMASACSEILSMLPKRQEVSTGDPSSIRKRPDNLRSERNSDLKPGLPVGVPGPPRRLVWTSPIRKLKSEILSVIDSEDVLPNLGICGEAAVGKSTAAALLANDSEILRSFCDGSYWVSLGENADPLVAQRYLASMLRIPGDFQNVLQGSRALSQALSDKSVLVVLDDVWTSAQFASLLVAGKCGLVLATARDRSRVLDPLGVECFEMKPLAKEEAHRFVALQANRLEDRMPQAVNRMIEEVGSTPLALSLVGSAIETGLHVDEIQALLESDRLGNHPYAGAFKVHRVAVQSLRGISDDLVEKFLMLSVFPPDTDLPFDAIYRLWASIYPEMSLESAMSDVERLAQSSLVGAVATDAGLTSLRLHAMTHALASFDCDIPPPQLHHVLLSSYRSGASNGDWHSLRSDTPYIWDHLVYHLKRAGEQPEHVVTDPRFIAARLHHHGQLAIDRDLRSLADGSPVVDLAGSERHREIVRRLAPLVENLSELGDVAATLRLFWPLSDGDRLDDLSDLVMVPDGDVSVGSDSLVGIVAGHRGPALNVAWSGDGSSLMSAGSDGRVKVWDASSGDLLGEMSGHAGAVIGVDWSSANGLICTSGADGTMRIWHAPSWLQSGLYTGHSGRVVAVAWSPDGTQVASASHDMTARLWDVEGDGASFELVGHEAPVVSVAWSPDGREIATASRDHCVRIWSVDTGECLAVLGDHTRSLVSVAWSSDGSRLASASRDKSVRLWDRKSRECVRVLEGHTQAVNSVAWSPDCALVATGASDSTIRIWSSESGQCRQILEGHSKKVESVVWSSNGRLLASASQDSSIRIWDMSVRADAIDDRALSPHRKKVSSVAWSPGGEMLATASHDGSLAIWQGQSSSVIRGHKGRIESLDWSPDGRWLVTGGYDNTVRLWDTNLGVEAVVRTWHSGSVTAVRWSPDGNFFGSASSDAVVSIWRIDGEDPVQSLTGHEKRVDTLAWSHRGDYLASAGGGKRIVLWDVDTGEAIRELLGHKRRILSVDWSPSGKALASASSDRTVRIWDMETGAEIRRLSGHEAPVVSVGWSPDGRHLASTGNDNKLCIWSAESGQLLRAVRVDSPLNELRWNLGTNRILFAHRNQWFSAKLRVS